MSYRISRRVLAAGTTSVVLISGGIAFAAGEGGGLGIPPKTCSTYTDPEGDGTAFSQGAVALPVPNDTDLDIRGVVMGTSASKVTTYIRVTDLINAPEYAEGDTWTTVFTAKGKEVTATVERGDLQVLVDNTIGAYSNVTVGGADVTTVPLDVVYDETNDLVIISLDRPKLEAALGGALAGTSLTKLSATSGTRYVLPTSTADVASAPAATAFAVDSNGCFGATSGSTTPSTGGPSPTDEPTDEPTEEPGDGEEEEETPTGPVLFDQPRAGCFLFKDAEGDSNPGVAPLSGPDSDPASDLTEVSLRSRADGLDIFAKVAALGSPSVPIYDGLKFTAAFTVGGKAVTVVAEATGPATSTPSSIKATAKLDEAKSNVVFSIPKADLETVIGKPLTEGTPITGLTITSNETSSIAGPVIGDGDGDSAAGTTDAQKTYAYGDNSCFQPPPGKLALSGATSGVYTDTATVFGTLVDSADKPVEGAKLSLLITGQPAMTATSDEDGKAAFVVPMKSKAGSYGLSVQFNGSDTVGPAGAGLMFTVLPETSVLTAKAGKGSVTATVLDNDKAPVVGQLVAFTVGKKVTKVKTNTKGVATLTKQTKGATVKVDFAAVPSAYTAAKSVSVKVL